MDTIKSFGIIVSAKLANFDLPKEIVAKAFRDAGIDEKFIPEDRVPRKAFQKALQEAITGEEGFMIRPVFKQGGMVSSGLVREKKNQTEKDLKYDVCNILTLNSDDETIEGKLDFRKEAIIESYKENKQRLGSLEIAFKIKEIFYVSMAINILCDKAIFIPTKYKVNIDKIAELFRLLRENGAVAQIDVIAVDGDSSTRNVIVKEFSSQTLFQLDKELEFSIKQREKLDSGKIKYLRPTAFAKQLDKLNMLKQRIQTYIILMDLTPEEDKPITDKLVQVETEILRNMDLCAARNQKFGKKDNRMAAMSVANPS